MNRIYTAGYGGHRALDLKRIASELGATVADIRLRPTSTRPEWTKRELSLMLGARYVHVPELGNLNAHTQGPIQIADEMQGVLKIARLARKAPVILLCGCPNLATCHRLTVAQLLAPNMRAAGLPHIEELAWPVRQVAPGKMKCLSFWQPHASLLFLPEPDRKLFETRGWATSYRGPLAIHAGKSKEGMSICEDDPFFSVLQEAGLLEWNHDEERLSIVRLPMGAIIGVVDLVDCRATGDWCRVLPEPACWFGDFSPGRFAWQVENPRPLSKPLPYTGHQNLFEVEEGPIRALLHGVGAPPTRAAPWAEPKSRKRAPRQTQVLAEAYMTQGHAPEPDTIQPTLF